ncbi:hypothetical protein BDV27DRAFT_52244 [Aspergillus caelatus]|uniref:Uncharacterized protein n=1 Tax=Aspergillus caelatus TaxID=61420 RepID=A0A5N6ZPS0_9EURO|nr:uncharacterized protein BDV27DRAFT_52244 [Aspergillus caelatus]KAE8359622.1 hypothetical protein BDV27DRAFT_52244 [Aspergillus caelatus]
MVFRVRLTDFAACVFCASTVISVLCSFYPPPFPRNCWTVVNGIFFFAIIFAFRTLSLPPFDHISCLQLLTYCAIERREGLHSLVLYESGLSFPFRRLSNALWNSSIPLDILSAEVI